MIKTLYSWAQYIAWIVLLVLFFLIGVRFTSQNTDVIQLNILQWSIPELSAGLALCLALFVGVIIGALAFLPALVIAKARVRQLKGKLLSAQRKP